MMPSGFKTTLLCLSLLVANSSFAQTNDDSSVQPYIESLKQKNNIQPRPRVVEPAPQVQEIRPKIEAPVQPYLDSMKETDLGESKPAAPSSNNVQPYIESLQAGRELKPRYRKMVDSAAGFAVVASNRFNITSGSAEANSFESIYETRQKYSPGLDLFYENQIFRDRYWGSFGPVVHLGFMVNTGKGIFTRSATREVSEETQFRFFSMPVSAGLSYRLVQLRFVVPFVQLAAVGIPYLETRNDDKPSRKGFSKGYSTTAGVALNLDWIGRKDAWAQYDSHGIIHTYLLLQMQYIRSLASTVNFSHDGFYAGLLFEF